MKIMAFATALTLALGALTLPFSESGYNFAYKAAASAQAGTNDFKYDSADIFTADSLLDRAILTDGERIFDHDPILAYTPTTRDWLFKQTAEEVVDNSWLISADTLWLNAEKAFSFEFVGEDSVFTRQQFIYETIIMDYLTYQYQSDEFKSDIEKSTTKFMYKIEKKVLDNEILSDEAFDNKIKGMSKEDAADFAKEQNYLKRFNEVNVSAYDSLIDGAETAKDYFKKLSKLMALQEASTTRLDFLQKIKDNTDDKALIKAIDDITAKYNDELSNVVWNEFLQTGMETFNGVVWDSIKDFFKKKFKIEIPGFSNIKLGMAGIDWAFNEKGMAESRIQLTILYIIHADVMQTYIDMRDSYINSGTEESAQEFVNAYSQYLAFIAYSSGITKEYLGETLIDGAYNSIKNLFSSTNQTAYNDYCSALNSEISICQTLDKYVGLAKDFYNKMSGYNASEDTKVPESAAIGTRFTSGYLTYEVTAKGEVEVYRCDDSAINVNVPTYVYYNNYTYIVNGICNYAFRYCEDITAITLSGSITSIGDYAFSYCTNITSITIPNGVTSIGESAFEYCTNLIKIKIPDSVISIGDEIFFNCTSITSITLSNGITDIGKYAFFRCTSLKNITIPNSVKKIDLHAFDGCESLTSIMIPDSVTSIGRYVFDGCKSLTTIKVNSNNKYYSSENGVLFNKDKSQLIFFPKDNPSKEYTIPDSVKIISDYAFYGCLNLKSIMLSDRIISIGESAFYDCTNLTDVYFSGSADDWAKIDIGNYNGCLNGANIHYNYSPHEHSYTEEITKQPTCTEEGEKIFTCDCGDTYTEIIPAKGHTEVIDKAVPATCTTDGKTEGSHCYVCGEVIKAQTVIKATGHNFGSWSTTKAATCTESGTQTRKCASCGKTETKTIPAKGHTSSSWIIDKQPAVGVKGSKHKECTVCHARLETATIPALAVTKQSISKASVTLSTSTYAYDGKAKKPGVTVKLNGKTLKNGTDYTVSYSNNTKVGTATVKITGKGNYTGSVSKTFKIKNNFKKATVLGISTKAFTGKNITQSITVKYNGKTLKNGTDYTVSYSNSKNIGTATVKIAGKGSYTGTITKTFKINPAKQEIQKLTAKSKAFFVDWAQKESATGYEIQYATNSKFSGAKKVTVTNNKTDKKTISKLSGKKKYYVRVRSYKTVKGKKYYGAWSSTKSVTTKK